MSGDNHDKKPAGFAEIESSSELLAWLNELSHAAKHGNVNKVGQGKAVEKICHYMGAVNEDALTRNLNEQEKQRFNEIKKQLLESGANKTISQALYAGGLSANITGAAVPTVGNALSL